MTPELRDAMRAGAKALRYVAAENVRRAARASQAAGRGMEGAREEAENFLAFAAQQRAWAGVLEREAS
jgi:hypothetical protein